MTTLEKFMSFAKSLPSSDRSNVDAALMTIMSSYHSESFLTEEQEAENARRFAMPVRKYAKRESIENILGRKLPS